MLKNTCEGVHLSAKLFAISLQTCKFTKNELHTYFSSILARFYIIYFVLELQEHLFYKAPLNVGFC